MTSTADRRQDLSAPLGAATTRTPRAPVSAPSRRARRTGAKAAMARVAALDGRSAPAPHGDGRAREAASNRLIELDAAGATIRRALYNERLEDGLYVAAQVLADVLAPAVAQLWLAEQAPSQADASRAGGQAIGPVLRLRAAAEGAAPVGQWPLASLGELAEPTPADPTAPGPPSVPLLPIAPEGLIPEIARTRRPLVLRDAHDSAPARAWLEQTTTAAWLTLTTLAAYPVQARGQLLGVLALGTARELSAHHLAALEAVADACGVAVEHDHLLSYSHTQEALAQTVVRQAPVAVGVLTGADHVFEMANPAFAQLLGVEGALKGRRLGDVVTGAARLSESLRLDAVYATGEPQAMVELPIHLGRGLTYWNVTSSPLVGRRGRMRGVLVAAVDMTHQVLERRRAMEAARAARERVGQMMALHATSLAVASQLGADPRELLTDILRRSIALLNARAGVVYVAHPERDELTVMVSLGLRGSYEGSRVAMGEGLAGQVARTSQGLRMDDTRLFAVRPALYAEEEVTAIIAAPLVHHSRVVGVLEVLDDADQRTFTADDLWLLELFAAQAAQGVENARTYVELERAYQAQRDLDRMKDDFIATASHELRTPLTGVQGYLDLLLDYPGSRDEPLALEFLSSAAAAAGELVELTTRLLQTSRLENGARAPRLGSVPLRAVVERAVRGQSDRAAAEGGHTFALAIDESVRVLADEQRLQEVLDNLLSNAVKYSPNGGTVRIACREEAAEGDAPTHAIVLVSDPGIGIPLEERERLFGRFSRLDAARSSQIRGTGLGLYICRQLMEAMGGSIWLEESTPGQGSTFALGLPLAASQDGQDETLAGAEARAWTNARTNG